MKTLVAYLTIISTSLSCNCINGQESNIIFSYDAGGNLIERKIQVVFNGRIGKFSDIDSLESPTKSYFKIYPNPTEQFLSIEGDLPEKCEKAEIFLSDLTAKILLTEKYYGVLKTLDVSNLKNGLYLLEIRFSKKHNETYKVIISK